MKTRLDEIQEQLRVLYAEKELIENQEKAANAGELIKLLPRLKYYIDDSLYVSVLIPKDVDKEFCEVVEKICGGFYHFSAPLTEQIIFRGDDNRYTLQFDPANTSDERVKKEFNRRFQLTQIVTFLQNNGVSYKHYSINRIRESIKQLEEELTEKRDDLAFVGNTITFGAS